jgi:riboflavin transporter FmnP
VFLYLIGFIMMFPYFELFKHSTVDEGKPFGYMVMKHYIFFLLFLPLQVSISLFLSYFEFKKMVATRDHFQIPIFLYNLF